MTNISSLLCQVTQEGTVCFWYVLTLWIFHSGNSMFCKHWKIVTTMSLLFLRHGTLSTFGNSSQIFIIYDLTWFSPANKMQAIARNRLQHYRSASKQFHFCKPGYLIELPLLKFYREVSSTLFSNISHGGNFLLFEQSKFNLIFATSNSIIV